MICSLARPALGAGIKPDTDRRLVATHATWRVLRQIRRTAERSTRPRTYTRHAACG